MRRKIAKRIRKNILRYGCTISREEWVRERNWKRKDCGYAVDITCNGWKITAAGHDELAAYKLAFESVIDVKNNPQEFPLR